MWKLSTKPEVRRQREETKGTPRALPRAATSADGCHFPGDPWHDSHTAHKHAVKNHRQLHLEFTYADW